MGKKKQPFRIAERIQLQDKLKLHAVRNFNSNSKNSQQKKNPEVPTKKKNAKDPSSPVS